MHSALNLIVALLISMATASAVLAGGDDSGALMTTLFERAKAGDIEGLRALESKVEGARSPMVRHAYHLARYIADPEGYAAQYIAEFPEDPSGVMRAVYEVELARGPDGQPLTPRFLYSFDELGKLAERGQPGATRKLFVVSGNSDGVVTEFVCEQTVKALVDRPATSVDALSSLQDDQRKKAYGCFDVASTNELAAVRASVSGLPAGKHDEISRELLRKRSVIPSCGVGRASRLCARLDGAEEDEGWRAGWSTTGGRDAS